MLAEPEHYKGITYIRISALPGEQKNKIREYYNREAIVKILKDNALINDCILYNDYLKWYRHYKASAQSTSFKKEIPARVNISLSEMIGR